MGIERRQQIVFMGSPDFALPSLEALVESGYHLSLVVCQPDKPAGRGRSLTPCPVRRYADARGLAVATPERIRGPRGESFLQQVESLAPDFLVVAAYGKILPQRLLDVPKIAPVNVHASLLPRWRGASPIQHAILAGDRESGVSIMRMEAGMDTGGVYLEAKEAIRPDDTSASLSARLASVGARALCDALPRIAAGALQPTPQPEEGVTLAPLIDKIAGRLDWREPAAALERRVRAMSPWPGAFAALDGKTLKVHTAVAVPLPTASPAAPGTVVQVSPQLVVACGESALALLEVQAEGKRRMIARDFVRGARIAPGSKLDLLLNP